ncbi:MAG: hypothetical protein IPK42_11375 [Betaproteobacteria bacterium]|nr:hypothetical protein [Betaproteobacteria bacterium]
MSAAAQRATVCWDPERTRPPALMEAVRGAGYKPRPTPPPRGAPRRREHRQALWRLFVASFCAMQVMMMATPPATWRARCELAPDLCGVADLGQLVSSLPVLAFSAGPPFSGAWQALRQRRISMEVPVALGLVITFIASTGATFDPGGIFRRRGLFRFADHVRELPARCTPPELRARYRAAQALNAR